MAYDIGTLMITDAETDARIADGIERNRKGNFAVRVRPGETVRAKLVRHKFRFGCNMFMLDEIPDDPEKNDVYKEKLTEFFNILTVPFYWDATEPEEGRTRYDKDAEKLYRRPPTDLCVEFCEKNGIEPREHALCYDHFFPDWLADRPDFRRLGLAFARLRFTTESAAECAEIFRAYREGRSAAGDFTRGLYERGVE